jgi:NADH:ubiquinone oxidoreductase subunit 6 (subunit J)
MTPNAVAFYAVALLIVLAAGAAVGLPSLRHAGYAGGGVIVLLALLELISGAYALAVVQLVVPAIAVGVVVLVLRHDTYRGLITSPLNPERFWIAGPIAVGLAAVLVITAAMAGSGWYPGNMTVLVQHTSGPALITVLHYRVPWALAISAALVIVTAGAGMVIGRRSGDEQTLDQRIAQRREREELARRRRSQC